jgi:hypothetical protein
MRLIAWAIVVTALAVSGCARQDVGQKPPRDDAAPRAQATSSSISGTAGSLPSIRLVSRPGQEAVEVAGLDADKLAQLTGRKLTPTDWQAILSLYVDNGTPPGRDGRPAVLGTYKVADRVLCFTPRFPLRPGIRYLAVVAPARLPGADASAKAIEIDLKVPDKPPREPTVIRHVYPSTSRLPENQLKFYIHFSAPMSRGGAYRYIHLAEKSGKAIEFPFLELDEELWDPQGRRFTLFFDPGRIKRGLKPREEVGPALQEGKTYSLRIDRQWTDADGNPLKEAFSKTFTVGAPEDRVLDQNDWKTSAPKTGTRQRLEVRFPRPLDHALLEECISVTGPADETIAGAMEIADEEKCWRFTPERPWHPGLHQLVVATRLEDLAGNRIGRPFEVDVLHPVPLRPTSDTVRLPFSVRPPEPAR